MAEKQPCLWNCGNKYEMESLKKHEHACLHRPYACPFSYVGTCDWNGLKKNISEHLGKHEEADFTKILVKTNTYCKQIKLSRVNDQIFVLQIIVETARRKFWFKIINISDLSYVCKLKYHIVVMKNNEKSEKTDNVQVKMCDIPIADDLTCKFDKSEMKMFNLSELNHIIDCATTEIICKFEIFNKGVSLNDNKRHLTHADVLFELECPVCKEYMIFKIFVCAAGHSLCGKCKDNLKSCPICRQILCNPPRNICLETVAQHLMYPCRNEDCDFIGNAVEIQEHYKQCALK